MYIFLLKQCRSFHITAAETAIACFLSQIRCQQTEGVFDALHMAALVAVGSVNAGADQAVTAVITCTQRSFRIGAVAGVIVNRIFNVCCLCCIHII